MTIRQTQLSAPWNTDFQVATEWWKQPCETGGGSLQPEGCPIHVGQSLATILAWLDARGPPAGPSICTRYIRRMLIACTYDPKSSLPGISGSVPPSGVSATAWAFTEMTCRFAIDKPGHSGLDTGPHDESFDHTWLLSRAPLRAPRFPPVHGPAPSCPGTSTPTECPPTRGCFSPRVYRVRPDSRFACPGPVPHVLTGRSALGKSAYTGCDRAPGKPTRRSAR